MLVTQKMCMTKDVGIEGNLFGGNMLAWADEAAAIYAKQATDESRIVTFKFSEIIFKRPVKVGETIMFFCLSPKYGDTSIKFTLTAMVGKDFVFSTECVFVAIDDKGKSKKLTKKLFASGL